MKFGDDKLDLFNEKGEPTGEVGRYEEIHSKGLLHKTVHVWLVNSRGEILLQKRSSKVRLFQRYYDNSAGGHILSGQGSIEAAQMETEEEVGIKLTPEKFKLLGTFTEKKLTNNGSHFENGFNDVYVVHIDEKQEKNIKSDWEIEKLRWVSLEEFEKIIGGKEPIVPHTEEFEALINYLKT